MTGGGVAVQVEEEAALERAQVKEAEAALAAELQRATTSLHDLERSNERVGDHGPFSPSV
jgi:hypothetical protein